MGDRASECRGLMEPIGAFTRPKGEHVIVHRCLTCGFERYNRIAADDDFEKVLALPVVPVRGPQSGGGEPPERPASAGRE
jgi:ribosome biogenesis GTPase